MKSNTCLSNWLNQAHADLVRFHPEEPLSSLYAIVEKNTAFSRSWLLANPQFPLDDGMLTRLNRDLQDLKDGKPLAYILGSWEFYGFSLHVSPAVLIPRPETELLVQSALDVLSQRKSPAIIADVGTGSACISIAIAKNQSQASIIATDISYAALEVAQKNLTRYALKSRVHLLQSDLLSSVQGRFDVICANLPYIPTAALQDLPDLRHEPNLALDGGEDGLAHIKRLLKQSTHRLAPRGHLFFEMQFDQAEALQQLAQLHFPDAEVIIKHDLSVHDRLLVVHT
ncbi:MAG TPA: peptide chain release factor N(5)-glutamine methyltransferase [Anaerolineaceae bacterium]|nr:peptide chain release factor N(5)-glutamine methyltransferase [Anaerolineaceae bacterium]